MSLYVLVGPDGTIYDETLNETPDEVWMGGGFDEVAACMGEEWRSRFWKRIGPSKLSARRLGWRVVKCRIVLEEE